MGRINLMLTFKEYLILEQFDVEVSKHGSHTYSTKIGDHTFRTTFLNKSTSEKSVPGRYEIGVTRQGPKDEKPTDALSGRSNVPAEHRLNAILAVRGHINHFMKNQKPYELHAEGNTREKRKVYRGLFDSLGSRSGGEVGHSDTASRIRFKPTEEQASKAEQIKSSNLAKIKAALKNK